MSNDSASESSAKRGDLTALIAEVDRADAVPEWVDDAWLADAWASEENPHAIAGLLSLAGHPAFAATAGSWTHGSAGAEKIRDVVGRAPTRAELVAGAESQRARRAQRMAEASATWPTRRAELHARRQALREPRLSSADVRVIGTWEASRG